MLEVLSFSIILLQHICFRYDRRCYEFLPVFLSLYGIAKDIPAFVDPSNRIVSRSSLQVDCGLIAEHILEWGPVRTIFNMIYLTERGISSSSIHQVTEGIALSNDSWPVPLLFQRLDLYNLSEDPHLSILQIGFFFCSEICTNI